MTSASCLQLLFLLTTATIFCYTNAAPAVCRTCTNGACNNTDDGDVDFDSASTHNRTKRESTIEQRSCVQFQLEMVLIPLSIAMIPVGLCALLLCACCCGPEESRGKMPDRFTKKGNTSKKEVNEIDDVELVCKDGVVMRRDSKKTRFSTAVSIIEARRISTDILDDRRPSMFSITTQDSDEPQHSERSAQPVSQATQQSNCQQQNTTHTGDNQQQTATPNGEETNRNENERLPRRTSSKKTRFAENVSVLGDSNA
ncbi:hypothetical protein Tcan_05394 [Toxocara canis]|uniref:Uncharacterized protein n=1 Tax=Toxocara canis TaxID=6265 RepID=A0A0B2VPR9_TOXCA|nr:hypothetical protein Tcan_05394 [Toxocara canis]